MHIAIVCDRDGLERVDIAEAASLADLKVAISNQLDIPTDGMHISKKHNLVRFFVDVKGLTQAC